MYGNIFFSEKNEHTLCVLALLTYEKMFWSSQIFKAFSVEDKLNIKFMCIEKTPLIDNQYICLAQLQRRSPSSDVRK